MSDENLEAASPRNGEVREESPEGCIAVFALGGAAVSFALAGAGEFAETIGVLPGLDFPDKIFLGISGVMVVGSLAIYTMGKAWDCVQSRHRS